MRFLLFLCHAVVDPFRYCPPELLQSGVVWTVFSMIGEQRLLFRYVMKFRSLSR